MEAEQIYPDVINKVLDLCRKTFGDTMLAYYEGDPIKIPKANLPCIIVEKIATKVSTTNGPTGHDRLSEEITIRIVFDKYGDIGVSDEYDLTERKLRNLVEARDPATSFFLPNTIMYALRTNISLGSSILNQDIDVSYGIQPRPSNTATSEAIVSVIISEIIQVQNRV